MLLLQQMMVLFLLMLIGYICSKKEIMTEEVSKKISAIVLNIANPAMILYGCMDTEVMEGRELVMVIAIVLSVYGMLLFLAAIFPKLFRVRKESKGTYRVMLVFSNIGFMGFPVIAAMYGKEALIYAALFTIPYNLLIYTYGINSIRGNDCETEREKTGFPISRIFNIGVICCILALIIYFARIKVPPLIQDTTRNLSNLTAPLSMMVIGASMATIKIKELFMDVKLIIFCIVKLIVLPVIGTLVIKQIVGPGVFVGVCMIILATPVGSMTAMIARQYDKDYDVAARGVALSTILSVVTIPLVAMIVGI